MNAGSEESILQTSGSLYKGAIKAKNRINGTLMFQAGRLYFYDQNASKYLFDVGPTDSGTITITSNSINFRFRNSKLAFIPDKAKYGGIAAGIGGAGLAVSHHQATQAGLPTWENWFKHYGYEVSDRGIVNTVLVGAGAVVAFIVLVAVAGYLLF